MNDIVVLDAFAAVPRERFAPPGREAFAYVDQPIRFAAPDGDARVMPAPMVLARMIQALDVGPGVKALDVAAGFGYGAAVLHHLGAAVIALESDPVLAQGARERLLEGGTNRVRVVEGPLEQGAAAEGPFDAILIEGRVEIRPQALLDSLRDEGRLVCVFGPEHGAKATLFVRAGDAFGARPLFDAHLPALKAFSAPVGFTF